VCRETILPAESVLSIQPTSLGDWLANVTVNNQIDRKLLKEGGTNIHGKCAISKSVSLCNAIGSFSTILIIQLRI